MIKLKNKEASALLSPTAQMLFSDSKRQFPVKDSFLILDLIKMIEERLKPFNEKIKEIISEYNGLILPDGRIKFPPDKNSNEALNKISELNNTELEYSFEKLTIKDSWPKLSVQEAHILQPIISRD